MKYFKLTDAQEQEMLNNVIDHTVIVDGFVFSFIGNKKNVYMNIYNTEEKINGYRTISHKSLTDHIDFINKNNVEKLFICAEDINFLSKCKTVRSIMLVHASLNNFIADYSSLYEMEKLEAISFGGYLNNANLNGTTKKIKSIISNIDFSKMKQLKQIDICTENTKLNIDIHSMENVELLTIMDWDKKNLSNYFISKKLKSLRIYDSKLVSLVDIDRTNTLEWLELVELKYLKDITDLLKIKHSLKALSIWNCPKIEDYSVLNEMVNLEHLELYGNKSIPNLDFLNQMKNLKTFVFSLNVEDGDLSNCLNIPYVYSIKDRKHYNLRNMELPKDKNYSNWYTFQKHKEDVF